MSKHEYQKHESRNYTFQVTFRGLTASVSEAIAPGMSQRRKKTMHSGEFDAVAFHSSFAFYFSENVQRNLSFNF